MGLSLKERYQEEALKEGKKITTSIKHLAIDLREIERWGSKEQEEESRAELEYLVLKKLQEEEEGEELLLI
ncbi:hypothetical protein ES708_24685 [subsurface metagenome]